MSVDAHFIHECDIERDAGTGEDAHGNDNESWSAGTRVDVAFRLVEQRERVYADEDSAWLTITTYKGLFAHDADIQEGDRLANVTLEDGTTLTEKFYIEELIARRSMSIHHKTAVLERRS